VYHLRSSRDLVDPLQIAGNPAEKGIATIPARCRMHRLDPRVAASNKARRFLASSRISAHSGLALPDIEALDRQS